MPWLTPDNVPSDRICWSLLVPNTPPIRQAVAGALLELTYAKNWEQHGQLTPEETADAMLDVFFSRQVCPMRIGDIVLSAASAPPFGRLRCDGSEVEQATYPELYAIIGDTFGTATAGYFRLPDMRGRMPLGTGEGDELTDRTLGDTAGDEEHQLTIDEIPSHSHSDKIGPAFAGDVTTPTQLFYTYQVGYPGSTLPAGGGQSHNNMPPFTALHFDIIAKV